MAAPCKPSSAGIGLPAAGFPPLSESLPRASIERPFGSTPFQFLPTASLSFPESGLINGLRLTGDWFSDFGGSNHIRRPAKGRCLPRNRGWICLASFGFCWEKFGRCLDILGSSWIFWIFLDVVITISITYTKAGQSDLLVSSFPRRRSPTCCCTAPWRVRVPRRHSSQYVLRRLSVKQPEGQRLSELNGMVNKQRDSSA